MAGDTLKDREGRLMQERLKSGERSPSQGEEPKEAPLLPLGPPHANEHWKALYSRISEVTACLRR